MKRHFWQRERYGMAPIHARGNLAMTPSSLLHVAEENLGGIIIRRPNHWPNHIRAILAAHNLNLKAGFCQQRSAIGPEHAQVVALAEVLDPALGGHDASILVHGFQPWVYRERAHQQAARAQHAAQLG